MSELERLKQNLIMDANGDKDRAFNIACQRLLYYFHNTSAGIIRERALLNALPVASAKPRVEPVLLESERG